MQYQHAHFALASLNASDAARTLLCASPGSISSLLPPNLGLHCTTSFPLRGTGEIQVRADMLSVISVSLATKLILCSKVLYPCNNSYRLHNSVSHTQSLLLFSLLIQLTSTLLTGYYVSISCIVPSGSILVPRGTIQDIAPVIQLTTSTY